MQQISTKEIQEQLGKMISWELCKKIKFIFIVKWLRLKQEYVLENETHKKNWDIEIWANHSNQANRQDLV